MEIPLVVVRSRARNDDEQWIRNYSQSKVNHSRILWDYVSTELIMYAMVGWKYTPYSNNFETSANVLLEYANIVFVGFRYTLHLKIFFVYSDT